MTQYKIRSRASEQGNVIGLVSMSSKKIVIERTRDIIYLKFVAKDFSPKIITPVLVKTPVTQRSPCYSAVSAPAHGLVKGQPEGTSEVLR